MNTLGRRKKTLSRLCKSGRVPDSHTIHQYANTQAQDSQEISAGCGAYSLALLL